jgi:hypothetical protein
MLSRVSTTSWLFLGLSAALALAGCSGDEEGPKADNALRSEQGFCLEWAKRACNTRVVEQCSSTKEGCIDRQSSFCESLVPSGYSATNAEDCLEAVENAYQNAVLSTEDIEVVLKLGGGCSQLIKGSQSEGELCTNRYECDTVRGFECVIKPGQETGTCQVPEFVGGGARCDDEATVCDLDLYCDADSGRCFEPESLNATCVSDVICGVDAFCEKLEGEAEGICTAKLGGREDCASDAECASGFCLPSLGQCVSSITLTVESSTCADL